MAASPIGLVPPTRGFYVNDSNSSLDEAQSTIDTINSILEKANITGRVELRYNKVVDSSPSSELYHEIRGILDPAGYGRVAIFAHGQGADIVYDVWEALKSNLDELTLQRVAILSLGGTSLIEGAVHFTYNNDATAKSGRAISGRTKGNDFILGSLFLDCDDHSIKTYLNDQSVRGIIGFVMKPVQLKGVSSPVSIYTEMI